CALVDLLGALDGDLARFLIDEFAVRQLLLDDVDLRDVLEAAGPLPRSDADDAAYDLGNALQHHHGASDRNDGLEGVDRWTIGRDVGMLGDTPGVACVVVSGIDQRGDARNEEHQIEHEVEPGLRTGSHGAVEEVAADVRVLRQRIGAGQHEQRAVQHLLRVEDPCRLRVQKIPLEDLNTDYGHQSDNQPGCQFADPGADAVDGI